jgi:type I restriction enzyme S subunit
MVKESNVALSLSKGMKQTEIGLLPEDWEVKTFREVTYNIIDYRGVTPKKLGMDWGNGEIVALSAGNVKKGYIDFSADCYFGSEQLYTRWMRNGHSKKDDIVFTLEAPLGNVALIPDSKKYILSQRTILLQCDKIASPQFIFQIFLSDGFQKYIYDRATGSTAQGIKRQVFETLSIPLPPLPEQEAIAEALSDSDAWIESLEQLIVKKRLIKQGTMQELLKPGEDWDVKKLGEMTQLITKGTTPTSIGFDFTESGINFIKV